MQVIVANSYGMCFGVRDALQALARIDQPCSTAIFGELVHNEVVLHQLDVRGFQQISEIDRVETPTAPQVVITAHGISQRRRRQLTDAGKTLIDTTCPLVTRVHRAAQDLAKSGAFVIVIGRPDHVEVEGITGDLDAFAVVHSLAEVETYPASRIGIVCQTTVPSSEAAIIRQRIEECNPQAEIRWIDTICQPTKDRQQALSDLLRQVDAVVVVGGRHSHNTRRLTEQCRQQNLPAVQVQEADELDADWFAAFATVGLTAGTSTLPETFAAVHQRLLAIAQRTNTCAAVDPLLAH